MSSFHKLKQEALKRWGKCKQRPQDNNSELFEYRRMLNNLSSFHHSIHPNFGSVCNWQIPDHMLRTLQCNQSNSVYVDSDLKFDQMLAHLKVQSQISFDTESNHDDSFLSMICVIQMSSATQNFVIDVFRLFARVRRDLSPIFSSPDILKIVHDTNDIQLLQRDFEIFCEATINMQEVFHLYKPQSHPISYSNMIKQLFGVELDKLGQLADWRIRPIPKQLVSYAIRDTHYLIRALDKVKRELISLGLDLKSILPSKAIQSMVRLYKFPKLQSAISCFDKVRLSSKRLLLAEEHSSKIVFLRLFDIRRSIAKDLDRPENKVLRDNSMYDMLAKTWDSFDDFARAFQMFPCIQSHLADMYVALDTDPPHGSDTDDDGLEIGDYDAMDLLPPGDQGSSHKSPEMASPQTVEVLSSTSASSKQPIPQTPPDPFHIGDLSDISDDELNGSDESECEIVVEEIEIDSDGPDDHPNPLDVSFSPNTPARTNSYAPRLPQRRHRDSIHHTRSNTGPGKHYRRRCIRKKNFLIKNEIRVGLGFKPLPFRFPRNVKSRMSE